MVIVFCILNCSNLSIGCSFYVAVPRVTDRLAELLKRVLAGRDRLTD